MTLKLFPKLFRHSEDGPIEAGQTLGMNPESVLERYFPNRNLVLRLLRIYSNLSLSNVADQLGISEVELKQMEESNERVPFQLVPRLAAIFKVDLKVLLILLGHVKRDSNNFDNNPLPLAAQYSGPDLTTQEKVDLEELFKMILEKIKQKTDA